MIYLIIRESGAEAGILEQGFRDAAAYHTEERAMVVRLQSQERLMEFLREKGQADIGCVDVSEPGGVGEAELLRRQYPDMLLVLVAEASLSPVSYLKPSIMAAALLLRPVEKERVLQVFGELLKNILPQNKNGMFLLETGGERQRISYGNILYFEARAKKIYVCMEEREYGFYDTIDRLEQSLPPHFIRCHRSYLVNRDFVENVRLSANCLTLRGGIELPLSRSYKDHFRRIRE